MKVISLEATNFKRLKAVRITPDGVLQQITGKNAAGKSSVLDAIEAALGGKGAAPDRPVRDGEDHAVVVVNLGDLVVTRKWGAGGKSQLVVQAPDGARYPAPQNVLDELLGRLSFDPLAFSRMDAKAQAKALRDLVGLDTTKEDAERAAAYDERAGVNRDIKQREGQLASMPPLPDPVPAPVSLADLAREHTEASAQAEANAKERRKLELQEQELPRADAAVRAAREALAKAEERAQAVALAVSTQRDVVAALVDPDMAAITARIQGAEQANAAARAATQRNEVATAIDALKRQAGQLTLQLEEIDAHKAAKLAAAKFPVAGLAINGDAVLYNGVPLSQASSAEQLRVGLAMGASFNPKLRVVLVRDGSLLDGAGLQAVAEWAAANDMQVLMERVADGGAGVGVVIEDGEVAK